MRVGEVEVPWQLSTPGPAGTGTHGQKVESAWATVGYMIGNLSTLCAWTKSARYSVVGVIDAGGPVGRCGLGGGTGTASLPVKPAPITRATCALAPIAAAIETGIGAAVAFPTMCARSAAGAAAPGR